MRKSATWMVLLDERILEHLDDEPWSSPRVMASRWEFDGMRPSAERIRERLHLLAKAGLAAHISGSLFEITGEGERYLNGQLNAEHLIGPKQRVKR